MLSALGREITDRVPFYLMGFYGEDTKDRYLRHFQVDEVEKIHDRLDMDVRSIPMKWENAPERTDENGREVTVWGGGGFPYDEGQYRPLKHAESVTDIEKHRWPDPDWAAPSEITAERDAYLSRYFVILRTHPVWCTLAELMGMQALLVNLKLNPTVVEAAVERIGDILYETTRRRFEVYGDIVDCYWQWDDYATDTSLFFSIEDWRRFFKPVLARLFDLARSHGKYVWYHCCGSMHTLIPDLLDMGMNILEPCQVHLPGMSPVRLKREFGRHLVFYGAVNTQSTLPFGTEDEVRKEVRERIQVLGEDGGYIIGPDHTVNNDVPVGNLAALYSEAALYSTRRSVER